jgi:hypothetical protein
MLLGLELSGLVQTSFVERANLTLRELVAPLSRRTWSMAYDIDHLRLHIMWGLSCYHLVRKPSIALSARPWTQSPSLSHAGNGRRADQLPVVGGGYPAHAFAGKGLVGPLPGSLSLHTNRHPPGGWSV